MHLADRYERQLASQDVDVRSDKQDNAVALAIDAVLLTALLLTAKKG